MAGPNTFDVPDPKQTLKKLPYDRAAHQPCGWTRIEMPTPVMYVRECHCHDCNQKGGRQRLATLKTVLLTSLTLLVIVLIINSTRTSSCGESHVSKGVPGSEDEMMAEVEGHRVERDVMPFVGVPSMSSKQTSTERKHKHRKSKGKKKKGRSRRSNNGMRTQLREMRRTLQENRRQISALNRSVTLNSVESHQRIAVHLTYTYANQDSLVYGEGLFVWTLMPSSPGYDFFQYNRAPDQEFGKDIYSVQIEFEGQYLIYSQVLVNGRNTVTYMPHDCAHETVLSRNDNFQRLLLKSFITQNGLGLPFGTDGSGNDGDPSLRPKDTTFQMGVFHLHHGDQIGVRIPPTCHNFLYSGDPHGSYFGLVRL